MEERHLRALGATTEEDIEKMAMQMSWEQIVEFLKSLSVELEKTGEKEKKLQAKLKIAKQLLQEYGGHPEKITPELYTRLFEFTREVESRLEESAEERKELLVTFKIVIAKLRKEKLAFKTREPEED
ncbi:MAG: hypothetical protein ACPL06_03180 [Candidatus Anstonellales archaeon]